MLRAKACRLALFLGATCVAFGCSSSAENEEADASNISEASANAALQIFPLDIWAQPLPPESIKLTVVQKGKQVTTQVVKPDTRVFLQDKATYNIHLEAPEHEPLDVVVDFAGGNALDAAKVHTDAKGQGVSLAHQVKKMGARELPTHALYLGLRHKWFSAEGRPARRGNDVKFMMDGEEAWSTVHHDVKEAKKMILASSWWWESNFEMVRPLSSTPAERQKNTVLDVFAASAATKRVLVGQFWGQDGIFTWVNTDAKLRGFAERPNDNFEFMGQANETDGKFEFKVNDFKFSDRIASAFPEDKKFDDETPIVSTVPTHTIDLAQNPLGSAFEIASYHQKFVVVDSDTAFVGGMNFRGVDWDTSDHLVYDSRRMPVDATDAARSAVNDKMSLPAMNPRKDYMVRLSGPSAQDVADVFHRRWDHLRQIKADYSENSSDFTVVRDIPAKGNTQVQVTATLPQPFWEHAIAETWFNAVRNAEKYIYIEDQYFRMPSINEAIAKRMDEVPALKLVVITMPMGKLDPACAQTNKAHAFFRSKYADRYQTFFLRAYDATTARFVDMDTHSKILIVDDKFLSVGSCNKNDRGIEYEGELNVAIVDEKIVRPIRQRIFASLMPGAPKTDDVNIWWAQLGGSARVNDDSFSATQKAPQSAPPPSGLLYTLVPGPLSECVMQSVGPDMT